MLRLLGILFGSALFLIGPFVAYHSAGHVITSYLSSASWVEVPARIHSIELVESRVNNSTHYSIDAHYTFRYEGEEISANRVGLFARPNNEAIYWQSTYRKLNADFKENEARAFVNPENPAEAYLDRTIHFNSIKLALLMLCLFCTTGASVAWLSHKSIKSKQARLQNQKHHDGINSDTEFAAIATGMSGLITLILGAGVSALVVPEAFRRGDYVIMLVLVFVVVGAVVLAVSIKKLRAYKKLGPSPMVLDPAHPGVGGQLGGTFRLAIDNVDGNCLPNACELQASVVCYRNVKSRRGRHYRRGSTRRRVLKPIWRQVVPVHIEMTESALKGSFQAELPDDVKPTTRWSLLGAISWKIIIEGTIPEKGSFKRSWTIVVGDKPAQSSQFLKLPVRTRAQPQLVAQAKSALPFSSAAQNTATTAKSTIRTSNGSGIVELSDKSNRRIWTSLAALAVGFLFSGMGVLILGSGQGAGFLILAVGLLLIAGMIYALGNWTESSIQLSTKKVVCRRMWFGLSYRTNEYQYSEPGEFDIEKTITSKSGETTKDYYALLLKVDDKRINLVNNINGKVAAEQLLQSIVRDVDIKTDQARAA